MGYRIFERSIRAGAIAIAIASAGTAQAAVTIYGGTLTGPAEAPPNASPGIGNAIVSIDPVAHQLFLSVTFSGLTGTTTASHIHAATAVPGTGAAGVATQVPSFIGFPLGVTFGSFSQTYNTLDLAFYNPAYVTANGGTAASAETALFGAIGSGRAYLNIHTSTFGGGEIRAFLVPVPEPATWAMMLIGFSAIGWSIRRRTALLAAA